MKSSNTIDSPIDADDGLGNPPTLPSGNFVVCRNDRIRPGYGNRHLIHFRFHKPLNCGNLRISQLEFLNPKSPRSSAAPASLGQEDVRGGSLMVVLTESRHQ